MSTAPKQWYYRKGTARFGPVSTADLKTLVGKGKIEPNDLLRGVGMEQWVPASKIKGLFPSVPNTTEIKPLVKEKLGLAESPATEKKQASKPPVFPPAVKKTTPPPNLNPPPKTATAVPDNNPFAQFGLDTSAQSSPNDPFAAAMSLAAGGFGGGADPFANLVALEKQGQAIYREPTISTEPDPFVSSKSTSTKKSSAGGNNALFIAAPFFIISILGFIVGCFMAWIPLRFICYMIAGGLGKASGALAGDMLRRGGIKNEVLSLGYGATLGIMLLYVLMSSAMWSYINAISMGTHHASKKLQQAAEQHRLEMESNPQATELQQAAFEGNNSAVENGENPFESRNPVSKNEDNPFGEDDEEDVDEADDWGVNDGTNQITDEERERFQKEFEAEMEEMAKFQKLIEKGLSPFGALSPKIVFWEFLRAPIYWVIFACILVFVHAHSTWMSNLGHDPTQNTGF